MLMPTWAWCAAAFAMSALLTWLMRRYALSRQLLDLPGERRSHQVPTPRGGGMAIVVTSALCLLVAHFTAPAEAGGTWAIPAYLLGLLAVAGIGWWDDHRPLSARLRLLVHVVSAAWLGALFQHASGSAGAWTLGLLVALMAVGLINVWNFMDGINGLAASQAAIAMAGFALALGGLAPAWALAFACIGFLPFNFPRARIFMGDGGSGALGYLLAGLFGVVCLRLGADTLLDVLQAGLLALLPLSAFLVDAGFTLASRILAGQRWWEPHSQHVYQRLARRWGGHTWVTVAYACFSITAVILFLRIHAVAPQWGAVAAGSWLLAAAALWLLLRKGLGNH